MRTFEPISPNSFVGLANDSMVNSMKEILSQPLSEVVTGTTASNLASVAAEDVPKFLPQIYGNTYVVANELGKVGHNLSTLAGNVKNLEAVVEFTKGRATLALLVGGAAGVGAYYLWKKYKNLENRVFFIEGKK